MSGAALGRTRADLCSSSSGPPYKRWATTAHVLGWNGARSLIRILCSSLIKGESDSPFVPI
jgi:hypothetical protein